MPISQKEKAYTIICMIQSEKLQEKWSACYDENELQRVQNFMAYKIQKAIRKNSRRAFKLLLQRFIPMYRLLKVQSVLKLRS